MTLVMPCSTVAKAKRLGLDEGGKAYPTTCAPIDCNQIDSQLPLKPVCPVSKTHLPCQKLQFKTRPSTGLYQIATTLRDKFYREGCPWAAKNRCVDKQLSYPLAIGAQVDHAPK